MKKIIPLMLLLAAAPPALRAQQVVSVCGEYTYHAPENVTPEQAKRTALERAQLEALAQQFGTAIAQHSVLTKKEGSSTDEQFFSLSTSDVKGEWLETRGEPTYAVRYEGGLVVQVSVCGKARAVARAGVDFAAALLRNGTAARHESDRFRHGDDLYLLFRSPADGYLAVYLVDEAPTAYCLLPYAGDTQGRGVRVEGGRDYLFFSEKHAAPAERSLVSEYTLTCEKAEEHNVLYLIFSPGAFTKANDSRGEGEALPRELPFEDFQKWLNKNKLRDEDMKVEMKSIVIKK